MRGSKFEIAHVELYSDGWMTFSKKEGKKPMKKLLVPDLVFQFQPGALYSRNYDFIAQTMPKGMMERMHHGFGAFAALKDMCQIAFSTKEEVDQWRAALIGAGGADMMDQVSQMMQANPQMAQQMQMQNPAMYQQYQAHVAQAQPAYNPASASAPPAAKVGQGTTNIAPFCGACGAKNVKMTPFCSGCGADLKN